MKAYTITFGALSGGDRFLIPKTDPVWIRLDGRGQAGKNAAHESNPGVKQTLPTSMHVIIAEPHYDKARWAKLAAGMTASREVASEELPQGVRALMGKSGGGGESKPRQPRAYAARRARKPAPEIEEVDASKIVLESRAARTPRFGNVIAGLAKLKPGRALRVSPADGETYKDLTLAIQSALSKAKQDGQLPRTIGVLGMDSDGNAIIGHREAKS